MLASSWLDPVLGIDIHWELIPTPAPTPMPIPNPFTGIIIDPMGLAAGLAISNAIAAVMGAPPLGPVLYWGGIPATNTGTEAKHVPGHILIPPGTGWAPVPKTPKPTIHPGETPKPPKPVVPDNDAVVITGSKTVHVMGSNAVRMGDLLLSCSEPVRLPSSVVLSIAKGAPILIGGPMALDLMTAILASLRTRFIGDSIQALLSRMQPSRLRSVLQRAACFLTGHPVDVATGRVLTSAFDVALYGPVPLMIERVYCSSFAGRAGLLGHGWSLSLDQAVWEEPGKVVYLAADGRELEFDTFDFPGHRLQPGQSMWCAIHRLGLRRESDDSWKITGTDGLVSEFAPSAGASDRRARIQRIRSISGDAEVLFGYDLQGRLSSVRDSGKRWIRLLYDDRARLTALELPCPEGEGRYVHSRYDYDGEGDLVCVTDAMGHTSHFEYEGHLLVRETNRNGVSFYFMYDGLGEDAWCTRTWGDEGIFDHKIVYDKAGHVTCVTNSLGHTSTYRMNLIGQVIKQVDPLGAATCYEYDERTLLKTKEVDPLGVVSSWEYDEFGNCTKVITPSGEVYHRRFTPRHRLASVEAPTGARWEWEYDARGRLVAAHHPTEGTTRYGYADESLAWVQEPIFQGRRFELVYGADGVLTQARFPAGGLREYRCDRFGRVTLEANARGGIAHYHYDAIGRLVSVRTATGSEIQLARDCEGDIEEIVRDGRRTSLRRGYQTVLERTRVGLTQGFGYDTENRLISVVNENGERYTYQRDACGRVVAETSFDGSTIRYRRDACGKVVEAKLSSGRSVVYRYSVAGVLIGVEYSDGSKVEFEFTRGNLLKAVRNEAGVVSLNWDRSGRLVSESYEDFWVSSEYSLGPQRSLVESSAGARLEIKYDPEGRAAQFAFGQGITRASSVVAVSRDGGGLELSRSVGSVLRIDWERDPAGRPLRRSSRHFAERARVQRSARDYQWRSIDQIAALADSELGEVQYSYDEHDRLAAALGPGEMVGRFKDRAGNVYQTPELRDRRYGAGGRLESDAGVEHIRDAEGHLIERRYPNGSSWRYRWNGAGLLKEVSRTDGMTIRFEYDGLVRRTRKTVLRAPAGIELIEEDIHFYWDRQSIIHQVSSLRGVVTWYWDVDGRTLLAKEHGGRRFVVSSDHLGTPTEMFDDAGALVWQMSLDLYGRPTFTKGKPSDCPFRWPGQYEDEETGLYYNRYRYYDPSTGSYISGDPIGLLGGLNPFAYVDDVNTQIDPFGLHIIEAFLNGQPVINPATGTNQWPNARGSGRNGVDPNGLGRLGDSENLLMRHLRDNVGREGLDGRTLTINSLGEPRMTPPGGPLPPCSMCGPGLQRFSNDMNLNIDYTPGSHGAQTDEIRPCGS